MITVRLTPAFDAWLKALRDAQGRRKIITRIDRLAAGNFGDVRPVGEGVSELRINVGPGYRVYLVQRGPEMVLILAGGDKSTQDRDIKLAKAFAREL